MEATDAQPPKTREEEAMEKVTDPFSEPYPLWHGTTFDKLPEILAEGIISADFAKRIGKTNYRRSYQAKHNNTYVSLERGDDRGNRYVFSDISILVEPLGEVIDHSDIPPELIDPNGVFEPWVTEFVVKDRIAPRELKGLQIREDWELPKAIKIMREGDPSQALPVYLGDSLVWPVKMTREQLRDHVQSQG